MRIIKKGEERVKVLIGKNKHGDSNLQKPVKSIIIFDTNVDEVFNKITKFLENEK